MEFSISHNELHIATRQSRIFLFQRKLSSPMPLALFMDGSLTSVGNTTTNIPQSRMYIPDHSESTESNKSRIEQQRILLKPKPPVCTQPVCRLLDYTTSNYDSASRRIQSFSSLLRAVLIGQQCEFRQLTLLDLIPFRNSPMSATGIFRQDHAIGHPHTLPAIHQFVSPNEQSCK